MFTLDSHYAIKVILQTWNVKDVADNVCFGSDINLKMKTTYFSGSKQKKYALLWGRECLSLWY
jgi:hypothetical protein